MYPIHVYKLSSLIVKIGRISFPQRFCLNYRCSVFLTFILEVMRTSGFEVPELDYCLEIDGKRVEMKQKLEEAGCSENSEVAVVSVNGESLNQFFFMKTEEEEDLPKESVVKTVDVRPVEAKPQPAEVSKPVEEAELEATVNPDETTIDPTEAAPQGSQSTPDDSFVTVTRRTTRKSSKEEPNNGPLPSKAETTAELPAELKLLLKKMMANLAEDSIEYKQMDAIKGVLEDYSRRLEEVLKEYMIMKDTVDEIHYENQMLREMYNIAVPDPRTSDETMKAEKNSWRRVASDRSTTEDVTLDLPDDSEALKKLVNEKYATALMNERRYIKEKKRCQKYRLIAEAAGVDGDSVNDVYVRLHEVMEHRDELKETNLNLKEEERALRQEIDARDDEIQRLKITVQARDEEIKKLVEQIQLFGEQLKEARGEDLPKETNSEEVKVIGEDRVKELEEQVSNLQQKLNEMQKPESDEIAQLKEKRKEKEEECKELRREKEQLERIVDYDEDDKTLKEISDLIQVLMSRTASRRECVKAFYDTRSDNTD